MSDPYPTPSFQAKPPCNPVLHIVCSILMTLFCCMPAGIVGIIFSVLSKGDLDAGRFESAVKNSKIAMWVNIGGLILTGIAGVFYILLFVVLGVFGG